MKQREYEIQVCRECGGQVNYQQLTRLDYATAHMYYEDAEECSASWNGYFVHKDNVETIKVIQS